MTEDEWYQLGRDLLEKWALANKELPVTYPEENAFEYAWELAWQHRGGLQ